jgi:nucleoside 2-deoxyribosyltransferase
MPAQRPLIYFAGPLFTHAEWRWNADLAARLRDAGVDVVLPQERAEAMLRGTEPFDARSLFSRNIDAIRRADVVVAILDGADADSGTCWECGFAFALGRPVIGVRTDFRGGGDDSEHQINLMLSKSCRSIITASPGMRDDISWLALRIHQEILQLT